MQLVLEVGGDLKIADQNKVKTLKMSVVGNLQYDERLLSDAAQPSDVVLTMRHYGRADAVIKVDKGGVKPALRDDRRLIGVQVTNEQALVYSPEGPLTRDELDLIDIPANTAIIDRLLPDGEVAVGDRWDHAPNLLAKLLCIDAVSQSDVKSELMATEEGAARIDLSGTLQGAIGGVATDIELLGRYKVDIASGRITWLALLIKEKRSIGHVGPGLDVVAKLQLVVQPITTATALDEDRLAKIEMAPTSHSDHLTYVAPDQSFTLDYDRRWHIMNETTHMVAMRLVDRGELLAQCNISPLAKLQSEAPIELAKFQDDIRRSLGKNFGQFVEASEHSSASGLRMLRSTASGEVQGLAIQWNYYHVSDREGHQAVIAFTVESELAPQLEDLDRALVEGLRFNSPQVTTASQPTPATAR